MLHEEVEKYITLTGDKEAWANTSISRIGGYLDGYEKGLEILDKIRAEIEKLQKMCDKNDLNLMAQYSAFGMVLDILDKYKAESEE